MWFRVYMTRYRWRIIAVPFLVLFIYSAMVCLPPIEMPRNPGQLLYSDFYSAHYNPL